jgi:hypothetical protein
MGSNAPLVNEAKHVEYLTETKSKLWVKIRTQNLYSNTILNKSIVLKA